MHPLVCLAVCPFTCHIGTNMSGVEFRLGRNDHLVVEDFLSDGPAGVAGITVDAKYVDLQQAAIDAAHAANVAVHVEPLTERLVAEGYSTRGLDYGIDTVINPAVHLASPTARAEFIESVVEPQLEVATAVTPPHFFVANDDALDLNLRLVQQTVQAFGPPVRPILAVQRTYIDQPDLPELIARRYRHAGAESIELRISPLGGEREGPIKLRSVFRILDGFRAAGMHVVVGSQGTIGETSLSLGLASGFSVGVGYRESYDHKSAISRQRAPRRTNSSSKGPRGPIAGVYLPSPAITIPRSVGKELYQDPAIRSRLICRLGACAEHVDGPIRDPRGHYLHARAADVSGVLAQPEQWRPMLQRDRLVGAVDLRELVNKRLPAKTNPLATRTLTTLISELDGRIEAAA